MQMPAQYETYRKTVPYYYPNNEIPDEHVYSHRLNRAFVVRLYNLFKL